MAGPQTWNRYSYVENNPILLADPSGNFGKCNAKMSGYLCKVRQNKAAVLEKEWQVPKPSFGPFMTSQTFTYNGDALGFQTPQTSEYSGMNKNGVSLGNTSNLMSGQNGEYQLSALVLGFGGGGGIGNFNQVGAEDVFMIEDDGHMHAQAFGYYGPGSGEGGSIAPYAGVVFNLKDFESYKGPFNTYNFTAGWGEGITLSYFHDSKQKPFALGAVQGFSLSPVGAFGFSFSATYTTYVEIKFP